MNEIILKVTESIEKILSDGKITFSDFPELIRLVLTLIALIKNLKA